MAASGVPVGQEIGTAGRHLTTMDHSFILSTVLTMLNSKSPSPCVVQFKSCDSTPKKMDASANAAANLLQCALFCKEGPSHQLPLDLTINHSVRTLTLTAKPDALGKEWAALHPQAKARVFTSSAAVHSSTACQCIERMSEPIWTRPGQLTWTTSVPDNTGAEAVCATATGNGSRTEDGTSGMDESPVMEKKMNEWWNSDGLLRVPPADTVLDYVKSYVPQLCSHVSRPLDETESHATLLIGEHDEHPCRSVPCLCTDLYKTTLQRFEHAVTKVLPRCFPVCSWSIHASVTREPKDFTTYLSGQDLQTVFILRFNDGADDAHDVSTVDLSEAHDDFHQQVIKVLLDKSRGHADTIYPCFFADAGAGFPACPRSEDEGLSAWQLAWAIPGVSTAAQAEKYIKSVSTDVFERVVQPESNGMFKLAQVEVVDASSLRVPMQERFALRMTPHQEEAHQILLKDHLLVSLPETTFSAAKSANKFESPHIWLNASWHGSTNWEQWWTFACNHGDHIAITNSTRFSSPEVLQHAMDGALSMSCGGLDELDKDLSAFQRTHFVADICVLLVVDQNFTASDWQQVGEKLKFEHARGHVMVAFVEKCPDVPWHDVVHWPSALQSVQFCLYEHIHEKCTNGSALLPLRYEPFDGLRYVATGELGLYPAAVSHNLIFDRQLGLTKRQLDLVNALLNQSCTFGAISLFRAFPGSGIKVALIQTLARICTANSFGLTVHPSFSTESMGVCLYSGSCGHLHVVFVTTSDQHKAMQLAHGTTPWKERSVLRVDLKVASRYRPLLRMTLSKQDWNDCYRKFRTFAELHVPDCKREARLAALDAVWAAGTVCRDGGSASDEGHAKRCRLLPLLRIALVRGTYTDLSGVVWRLFQSLPVDGEEPELVICIVVLQAFLWTSARNVQDSQHGKQLLQYYKERVRNIPTVKDVVHETMHGPRLKFSHGLVALHIWHEYNNAPLLPPSPGDRASQFINKAVGLLLRLREYSLVAALLVGQNGHIFTGHPFSLLVGLMVCARLDVPTLLQMAAAGVGPGLHRAHIQLVLARYFRGLHHPQIADSKQMASALDINQQVAGTSGPIEYTVAIDYAATVRRAISFKLSNWDNRGISLEFLRTHIQHARESLKSCQVSQQPKEQDKFRDAVSQFNARVADLRVRCKNGAHPNFFGPPVSPTGALAAGVSCGGSSVGSVEETGGASAGACAIQTLDTPDEAAAPVHTSSACAAETEIVDWLFELFGIEKTARRSYAGTDEVALDSSVAPGSLDTGLCSSSSSDSLTNSAFARSVRP